MTRTVALIVAAGRGERARGEIPKQYRHLAGRAVLRRTVEAFKSHPAIDDVLVVIRDVDRSHYESAISGLGLPEPAVGGATRQDSVRNGLEVLATHPPTHVLVHDAARPLVSAALIGAVAQALVAAEAAAPLFGVPDTLRRKNGDGYELVPRDDLWRTQTPQGFHFEKILAAHRRFTDLSLTDDLALAERAGMSVAAVAGEGTNLKLTTEEDFPLAEALMAAKFGDLRTGTGFDVHRFGAGDHVMLCGVKVPHGFGLEGHSDADVGLHALTDAILGAISAGDIGAHFPPTDERWRGAGSHIFLAEAASLVSKMGGVIAHADVTLICERPKVLVYRDAMRARIAEILELDIGRVSVKATTTDTLGFTGRREGIAAQAVATIRLSL